MPPQALETTSVFAPNARSTPHRERDLPQGIPFVAMKPPLHGHDRFAGQRAANQPTGMRLNRGQREAGDILVIHRCLGCDLCAKPPQASSQNDSNVRGAGKSRTHGDRRAFNGLKRVMRRVHVDEQ